MATESRSSLQNARVLLVLALLALGVGVWFAGRWILAVDERSSTEQSPVVAAGAVQMAPAIVGDDAAPGRGAQEVGAFEGDSAHPTTPAGSLPPELERESLRLAIDGTLDGRIDPGQFLDIALALTQLDVRANPIPEASPNGALRYPVLGMPEGVEAELWVQRSENPDHGGPVLSYRMSMKAEAGTLRAGAERGGYEAQITVWTDKSGRFKNYSVLTDSRPTPQSVRGTFGTQIEVPTGVLFSMDAGRPQEWTAVNCIQRGGIPGDSETTQPVVRGTWPRLDDLGRLKDGMQRVYSKL